MRSMTPEQWLRRIRWGAFGLLGLATVVATLASPSLACAAGHVPTSLALSAVTAVWMAVTPHGRPTHYVGRTILAFLLCLVNPLYAIFAFIGFVDAYDALRGRWAHVGIAAVGTTQAGAQSGGLPPEGLAQAGLFAALLLVNGGLATIFLRFAVDYEERNDELTRLNDDLQRMIAENEALQEELLVRAREDGV